VAQDTNYVDAYYKLARLHGTGKIHRDYWPGGDVYARLEPKVGGESREFRLRPMSRRWDVDQAIGILEGLVARTTANTGICSPMNA
jgi:hypothetical protein